MYIKKDRQLNRWPGYDYSSPGLYFVTICTHGRQECFGEIKNNQVYLNDLGQIVLSCWNDLPAHYHNCHLDEYIIMPNHFHGIIEILETENYFDHKSVGTGLKPVPTHGISEMMRGFKTFSSRKINDCQNDFTFAWQRSFHDHVIRNEKEFSTKREYIANNPVNWESDRNNLINFK